MIKERGVAQLARALALGARGRRFKSCHPEVIIGASYIVVNIGRNDPCHCGSGKKYKKCHLEKDERKDSKKRLKAAMNAAKVAEASSESSSSKAKGKIKNWIRKFSPFKKQVKK